VRALRSFTFAIRAALRRRLRLSAQEGSLLIEVMVGALVLGVTSMAVLNGLDGAQETGRENRDRTEYANLAQQEIERLRSMPISAIANLDLTRTVTVGQIDYTVHSETEWTTDDPSAIVSCTDYDPLAEYLRVAATVSTPGNKNPVEETTLLTPAPGSYGNSGTATVQLTDRDGNPQPGLNVTLSGPGTYTETTNALGCAVFRYISAGDYTAEVSAGVSWTSELPATAPVTVNAGRTTLNPIEIDDPASLRASFKTPAGVATQWSRMTIAHAKLPAGFKVFPNDTATTHVSSIDAAELFPHHDAYGVYAGSCESNNPAVWDPDYFVAGTPGYVELDPGDNLVAVDVRMPVLTIRLDKEVVAGSRFHVHIKQVAADGAECADNFWDLNLTGSTYENATTVTQAFQLPFGRYKVCVDDGFRMRISSSGSNSSHYNSPATSDASNSNVTAHRMTTASNGALTQTDRALIESNPSDGDGTSGTSGTCPDIATW
jgi:Tfp pilus assembly protein PilV